MSTRTQCDRLLTWMSAGRSVTTMLAMRRWGICRLSERVREIERRGHKVARNAYKRHGHQWTAYRLQRA